MSGVLKLDSKRRDLAADAAIICSNSGFTKKALRKAERLAIDAVSAMAAGHRPVRPVLERELVVKRLSVDSWSVVLYPAQASAPRLPATWDARTLRYDGRPVVNWLHTLSLGLLRQYEGEPTVAHTAAFKTETPFVLEGNPVVLLGFGVKMSCSRTWLSETVREDVSLGVYNHITRRVSISNTQYWSLGWIDPKAWQEIQRDSEPEECTKPPEPGTIQLNITLLNPIAAIQGEEAPPIEGLIGECKTDLLEDSSQP